MVKIGEPFRVWAPMLVDTVVESYKDTKDQLYSQSKENQIKQYSSDEDG